MNVKNTDKEEVLKKAYETAFTYEKTIGNCPQCLLATMYDIFGLGDNDSFKSGTALAGGGALAGDGTCGALSGGYMALGLAFGRDREGFKSGKKGMKAYKAAKRLRDKFVEEYGSVLCKEVQKKILGRSFDLWDKEDYQKFDEMGGHTDKCTDVVGKTAAWTAEIILEEKEKE